MFEVKKDPKRVAVVGTGSGWELLPKNTSLTVYGLNDLVKVEKYGIKVDKLFILDVLDEKPQVVAGVDDLGALVKRINDLRIPFIAPYPYEEIPLSEGFPLEKCVKEFGLPYFNNTIAYMIAYALLEGAEEINMYGVNQAGSAEYIFEKGSVEYWLGIAVGRGVKVTINGPKSELLGNKPRWGGTMLYGYNARYDQIISDARKFGEPVVKRLSVGIQPGDKTSRRVNP